MQMWKHVISVCYLIEVVIKMNVFKEIVELAYKTIFSHNKKTSAFLIFVIFEVFYLKKKKKEKIHEKSNVVHLYLQLKSVHN